MAAPTPLPFDPVERFSVTVSASLPAELQVTVPPTYYKALLLRLLVGTLSVHCNKTSKTIKISKNYSILGAPTNGRLSKQILKQAVLPSNLADYSIHVSTTLGHNSKFYREIFFEFCGYFFETQRNNCTSGFVHLYRILERMAYCLPLLWAAKALDYERTFVELREYFNNPKIGELGVLKKFIPSFVDPIFLATQTNLNIVSIEPDWQRRYFDVLDRVLGGHTKYVAGVPHSQITVTYGSLTDLLINIRNRYFHALTGVANSFDSEGLVNPNEFFSILNEELANWLGFLIFRIFENELS